MAQLVVIAGLSLLIGLGGSAVRQFEDRAANDVRSKLSGTRTKVSVKAKLNGIFGGALGDLKRVTIVASEFETAGLPLLTEPDRSKKGKVGELHLNLTDFYLTGLRVESLKAVIPRCRYDYSYALKSGRIRLSESGVGSGTVTLLDRDLSPFILRKFKEIKKVTVTALKDEVLVEGYGEFLVINTNFSVRAKLSSPNGSTLILTEAHITFDGRPAEQQASRVILDTLNPVVDLPKDLHLMDAVKVRGVKITPGKITAWGDTKIPIDPSLVTGVSHH